MDTEHRHELKENDLAEFFRNFGQWWSNHGNAMLVLVLVVVVGFTGYHLLVARTSEQYEAAWRDLANSTTPEAYRSVAELSEVGVVQATAYLRGADLLLAKASQESSVDADNPDDPVRRSLQKAEEMYLQAIEVAKAEQLHDLFQLNAWLGLASIYEAKHEFEKAADYYQKVQKKAGPLLFNVEFAVGDSLGNGVISDELRQQFEKQAISLSDNAAVVVEQESSRWRIRDADKVYALEKEGNTLNIYTGPTNRLLAARAKAREAMLEKLAVPVIFAPEPIPQTPPGSVGDQVPVVTDD